MITDFYLMPMKCAKAVLYKTITTTISCMLICFYSFGQKDKNTMPSKKTEINYDSVVYYTARINGDYIVAINTLYYMLAKDPANITYKDSLARLYLISGGYDKCANIAEQIIAKQPDNQRAMEFIALSEKALGNFKYALQMYEKLYSQTKDLGQAYSIAELQFGLKRFGECMQTIESILANPQSEKKTLQVYATAQTEQTVSYKAATLNIQGMVHKELHETQKAKVAFNEALAIAPDFLLPASNIKDIDKNNPTTKKK